MTHPHEHRPTWLGHLYRRRHTPVCRHCGKKIVREHYSRHPLARSLMPLVLLVLLWLTRPLQNKGPLLLLFLAALVLISWLDYRWSAWRLLEDYRSDTDTDDEP